MCLLAKKSNYIFFMVPLFVARRIRFTGRQTSHTLTSPECEALQMKAPLGEEWGRAAAQPSEPHRWPPRPNCSNSPPVTQSRAEVLSVQHTLLLHLQRATPGLWRRAGPPFRVAGSLPAASDARPLAFVIDNCSLYVQSYTTGTG